jgi:predicted thioesterase
MSISLERMVQQRVLDLHLQVGEEILVEVVLVSHIRDTLIGRALMRAMLLFD